MNDKKKHSNVENQSAVDFEQKNQLKYVHNVIGSEMVPVIHLVIKAPSNIYDPDFNKDVGVWEQYWTTDGKKIFEHRIDADSLIDKSSFGKFN